MQPHVVQRAARALGLAALIGDAGACVREVPVKPQPVPRGAACPAVPDARVPEPAPTPAPADADDPWAGVTARCFAGPDSAEGKRTRRPTAVLLFAPPERDTAEDEPGIRHVPVLRFQPLVCSLGGRLGTGAACGEAMPARARVRVTSAGAASEPALELERSALGFDGDPGGQRFAAPYEPACCMYSTCVGRTVPYYPRRTRADGVLSTTRTVLAVWPADADIDLTVFAPGDSTEPDGAPGPAPALTKARPDARVLQALTYRGRSYAALAGGQLLIDPGPGKEGRPLIGDHGARAHFLLAGADVNGDGKPELLVYGYFANDYGISVLSPDAAKPLYEYSCGNI